MKEKRYVSTKEGFLYTIELDFISIDEARFNNFTGYLTKGLITSLIQGIDIRLSKDLEFWRGIKPYSVSPLMRNSQMTNINYIRFRKGDRVRIFVSSFEEEIINRVMDAISREPNVKIGDFEFSLKDIKIDKYDLIDFINYQYHKTVLEISFITPTAFSTLYGKENVVFPMPSFLFGNLARLWNENAPKGTQIDIEQFKNWIWDNVSIIQYNTHLEKAILKKQKIISGFVGRVQYRLRSLSKYGAWIWGLARLGELFGVGIKRTIGMGRIRILSGAY